MRVGHNAGKANNQTSVYHIKKERERCTETKIASTEESQAKMLDDVQANYLSRRLGLGAMGAQ